MRSLFIILQTNAGVFFLQNCRLGSSWCKFIASAHKSRLKMLFIRFARLPLDGLSWVAMMAIITLLATWSVRTRMGIIIPQIEEYNCVATAAPTEIRTIDIFELHNKIWICKYFAYVYQNDGYWFSLRFVAMTSETAKLFSSLHSIIKITHLRTEFGLQGGRWWRGLHGSPSALCKLEKKTAELFFPRITAIQNYNVWAHRHDAFAQPDFIRCSAFRYIRTAGALLFKQNRCGFFFCVK